LIHASPTSLFGRRVTNSTGTPKFARLMATLASPPAYVTSNDRACCIR